MTTGPAATDGVRRNATGTGTALPTPIGVGIIGLGTIHALHMEGFRQAHDLARVVAVCDVDGERSSAHAARLSARPFRDYQDLLDDPEVDMVDVLPHNLHAPVVTAALQAGKHVLVEKPMAPSVAECEELVRLAHSRNLTFTVAENTRFVAAYREVERLLHEGAIGTIRSVRTFIYGSEVDRLRDPTLWKGRRDGTVGGAVMDAGAHTFYLLGWLFGGVTEVRALGSRLVEQSEVEDNAIVTGRLGEGGIFSAEFSFTAEIPWGERLEVYGSEGSIVVDQLANPPVVHYAGKYDFDGTAITSVARDALWWKGGSIAAGVVDFVEALAAGRRPQVDPADGVRAMRVVEAAYRSMDVGGAPVEVA